MGTIGISLNPRYRLQLSSFYFRFGRVQSVKILVKKGDDIGDGSGAAHCDSAGVRPQPAAVGGEGGRERPRVGPGPGPAEVR